MFRIYLRPNIYLKSLSYLLFYLIVNMLQKLLKEELQLLYINFSYWYEIVTNLSSE